MFAHLQSAVDRYPEEQAGYHIHPFSKVDAQIVVEILELFRKMNFIAAVDIIRSYKKVADEDIYQNLLELNTQIGKVKGNVESQENQTPLFQRYLVACGRRIDLYLVIHYDAIDVELPEGRGIKYCVLLNKTPADAKSIPLYANEYLPFDSEEERNDVLKKLDKYFELYRGLFI